MKSTGKHVIKLNNGVTIEMVVETKLGANNTLQIEVKQNISTERGAEEANMFVEWPMHELYNYSDK